MACTDVQTIQPGNGVKTQFSFNFPYIFKSEIHVYFWNATTKLYYEVLNDDATYSWEIENHNPTIVKFTGDPPPSPTTPVDPGEEEVPNVKIRRITDIEAIRALFNPGAAIRSDDLNQNFEQLRFAVQEANCQDVSDNLDQYLKDYYWDRYDNTIYKDDTWVSNDTKIATTAAMDKRFQDEAEERLTKSELSSLSDVIPDNDDAVPTTGAVKDYVDHVIENDIIVDDGLDKSASNGVVTIGIAAGSVDLDRIKPGDIKDSTENSTNTDDTIATTLKIEKMIDEAITGDIAGSDGVSITDDTDGTITIGLSDGQVDLEKIKAEDKITYAEQNSSASAPTDNNIFTAFAAARRFDTLVQSSVPQGNNWETGKTWLQNDDNSTLSIWNGNGWTTVSEGGGFRAQDKVIYVDKAGGSDIASGHRISTPKATIQGAIDDINAAISISTDTADGFNGGSGYLDGEYNNVPLNGGTTGANLTATIIVANGAATQVTNVSQSLLEEYQIGDVLTVNAIKLGNANGSGFALPITGDGDGMTVIVAAGVYQESAPIQIKRRNVSIIGMALRSTIVHPTVQTEIPSTAGNNALFELNSGSFIQNLTLTGMKAGTSGNNSIDSVLPDKQGWNFAFYDNCVITKSPYIQNCTNFSDSQIDNSDLRAHRPRGGQAGDTTSAPTGGGMLVDGSVPKKTSPLRSMVSDSYTHVGLNGPGILVTNNGYAQCTSSYAFFNKYHVKCLNGGQANLAASTSDFGERSLVADGKSSSAIFTATADGSYDGKVTDQNGDVTQVGDKIITIGVTTPAADWFGASARPAENMLLKVNNVFYPILNCELNIPDGFKVTISNPNPSKRSQNFGLDNDVSNGATIEFFLRSQIASSGHTMEYVGAGMDYDALPENGGVPDDTKQVTEENSGKVWTATTDHNGKFKIGGNQNSDAFFEVDQQLGFVTIPEGSIAFNLLSDPSPELADDLDTNGKQITNLPTPTDSHHATSKDYVDGEISTLAGNIPNTSTFAPKNNPVFTGTPKLNSDPLATQAYVNGEVRTNSEIDTRADNRITAATGATIQAHDAATAKTNATQTFTKGQRGQVEPISSSNGTLNINFNLANNFEVTLNQAITSITASNITKGQSGSIFFEQPASTTHLVEGWNTNVFKFSGNSAPTFTASSNAVDRVDYIIKSTSEIHVVWSGNY